MLDGVIEHRQTLSLLRVSGFGGVSFLQATVDRDAGVSGLYVDLSKKTYYTKLDGIFQNSAVHIKIHGKSYQSVDALI